MLQICKNIVENECKFVNMVENECKFVNVVESECKFVIDWLIDWCLTSTFVVFHPYHVNIVESECKFVFIFIYKTGLN